MTQSVHPGECPPELMSDLIETVMRDDRQGLARIEVLLRDYGGDARLHFLRGSLFAAVREYGEARQAMQKAVEVAPGYAIARFQLGLLELSSGDATAAVATLQPLEELAPDNALRLFARGLQHLVADDFARTVELLREGMALNTENLPLNADMQLIIDQAQEKLVEQAAGGEPVSAAHLLLQQYSNRATKQ